MSATASTIEYELEVDKDKERPLGCFSLSFASSWGSGPSPEREDGLI